MVTVQLTIIKCYNVSNKVFVMNLDYLECFPVPNTVSVYYRDLGKNIGYEGPLISQF